jgi:hypothetical protein
MIKIEQPAITTIANEYRSDFESMEGHSERFEMVLSMLNSIHIALIEPYEGELGRGSVCDVHLRFYGDKNLDKTFRIVKPLGKPFGYAATMAIVDYVFDGGKYGNGW